MADHLAIAGLVLNTLGAATLAYSAKGALTLLKDGSVMPGRGLEYTAEENTAYQIKRHKIQHYGQPVGWVLMLTGFAVQLAALLFG